VGHRRKSWFGAPVKESFAIENGRAKWTSLDDSGDADAKGALYIANNGTPWAIGSPSCAAGG
jgi:hypothetical protein